MPFHTWFQRQLARREMSQADFARRSAVPTATVSTWATGARIPDPRSCDVIADALGMDLDLVLTAAGHRPNDPEIPIDDPRSRIAALVRRVNWTSEREFSVTRMLNGYIEFDRKGERE